MELHPAPGSTRTPNCINCANADVRLITPDDGQKDCQKCVVIIPIKLELSASVGFIHKEDRLLYTEKRVQQYGLDTAFILLRIGTSGRFL
jgi:hypothetical protein